MQTTWDKKMELHTLMERASKLRAEIQQEEQERLQARLTRLPPHQRLVLEALVDMGADYCRYRRDIVKVTGLGNDQVGRALPALKRLGFIELHRGLMNDDGEVSGSGYCPTKVGLRWWADVEEKLQ